MQRVAAERTGWRDMELSLRHRHWGLACACTDVDFLEYAYGEPTAMWEAKRDGAAWPPNKDDPKLHAQSSLATSAGIPFFVVLYTASFSSFDVLPFNKEARRVLRGLFPTGWETVKHCTEREFVQLLYRTRGMRLPKDELTFDASGRLTESKSAPESK